MNSTNLWQNYTSGCEAFAAWRRDAAFGLKMFMALGMAALTGLAAQIALPVPGSPVPVTGQTFAVLLSGVVLGRRWGGLGQILYISLGALGIPWYAGGSGGIDRLFGATGGYLIGFVLASFFLGRMTDQSKKRDFFSLIGLMWFSSFVLIQIPGLIGLYAWMNLMTQKPITFIELINMGFLPFVVGDVIKIMLAASAAKGLRPGNA